MAIAKNHKERLILRRRIGPPLVLSSVGLFCFGLPAVIGMQPDTRGAALAVLLVTGLPALWLGSLGWTLFRLRVELEGARKMGRFLLRLPKAGVMPWAPWTLHSRDIPVDEVSRIDVVLEPHATAADGISRRYVLRTKQGDYHFSSIWFKDIDRFTSWCHKSFIEFREGTADQIMDAASPDSQSPSLSERCLRGCGWFFGAVLTLTLIGSIATMLFGDADDRWLAAKAFVVAGAALACIPILTRYRQVR